MAINKDSLEIISLKADIGFLQIKLDSVLTQNKAELLMYQANEKTNLISQINQFYDSAWMKLIVVITVLGVLVPIIAQYFQRKSLQDLTSFVERQLKESFELKLLELKEFNENRLKSELEEYKSKINELEKRNKNLFTNLDIITYFLQGRSLLLEKDYINATASFMRSSMLCLESDRSDRIFPALHNVNFSLKYMQKKKDFLELNKIMVNSSFQVSFNDLVSRLKQQTVVDCSKPLLKIESEIKRLNALND